MKVMLINPPIREWARPNIFPAGLGYIASVLLRDGHEVEVMDINALRWDTDAVETAIRGARFDVVGIGGIVTTYRYVKWLVAILKRHHPDRKIIVGGGVATSIPDIMFANNRVDILCMGEGEETVRDIVNTLGTKKELSSVKGIAYRDDDGKVRYTEKRPPIKNLDTIPMPAWNLFPMETYLKNPVGAPNRNKWIDGSADGQADYSINLCATRGCPYACIYCYHDFMGQGYRIRSPQNIVSEIETLYKKYGVRYFHFMDDEFVVSRDFVREFCSLIKNLMARIGCRLTWGCTGRVNLMTEDLVAAMSDAGCVLIGYGIESGSQRMLDLINKRVSVEQAKNAVRITKEYLGWADCSFMIGYPGECDATIRETMDFCMELNLAPEVIFFLTPYPGTELYTLALQQGRIPDEEAYILDLGEQGEKVRVNFTEYSDAQLLKIQENMIKELKAWNTVKHSCGEEAIRK